MPTKPKSTLARFRKKLTQPFLSFLFSSIFPKLDDHYFLKPELDQVDNFHHYSNHSLCNTSYMSPRRTPLREDSVCKLLENSCDQDLLSDLDDDDEEIELLVEVGQDGVGGHVPAVLVQHRQVISNNNALNHDTSANDTLDDFDDDESLSLRDSFSLGAGCLPCTPKSQKKSMKSSQPQCQHGKPSNWCCGVVAHTVKKTTKKF